MGTKREPGSFDCYEHAEDDEPLFTLLARDAVAPAIVRTWANLREDRLRALAEQGHPMTGAEVLDELDQIAEARESATAMEMWRMEHRG